MNNFSDKLNDCANYEKLKRELNKTSPEQQADWTETTMPDIDKRVGANCDEMKGGFANTSVIFPTLISTARLQ